MAINIELNDLANLQNENTAVTKINQNNATIENALTDAVSRTGVTPNQMEANFDMNGNQILNLPAPATPTSPLRLQDLETFNGGGTIANIPAGGTTGQSLQKKSNTDYDLKWAGNVTSVGVTMPGDFTVVNSPVTLDGTIGVTWATAPTGTGAVVRANAPALVNPTGITKANVGLDSVDNTSDATKNSATATLTNKTIDTANNTITLGNNFVTNTNLAQAGAYTFKGNATSGTANVTDVSIPTLTAKITPASDDIIMIADSTAANAWKRTTIGAIATATAALPTTQVLSGTGTYTTPANALWLRIRMVGGGAGGQGGGTTGAGNGTSGGDTTFGSFVAKGGNGQSTAGNPGSQTANTATGALLNITGSKGQASGNGNIQILPGGNGGGNIFGPGAYGGTIGGGGASSAGIYGTGGGGGSLNVSASGASAGAGGNSGGYIEAIIKNPSSTYSFSVGANGTGGSAGTSGGAGAAGFAGTIIVEEYYNS